MESASFRDPRQHGVGASSPKLITGEVARPNDWIADTAKSALAKSDRRTCAAIHIWQKKFAESQWSVNTYLPNGRRQPSYGQPVCEKTKFENLVG